MTLLVWIVRVLVALMVLRMIVRLFTVQTPVRSRAAKPTRAAERSGGTLVRDPQCGTYIPQSTAIAISHGNATTFFCSISCRDAWAAAHRS